MRFLIFLMWWDQIQESYPNGGWSDFAGAGNTLEKAKEWAAPRVDNGMSYQIVDLRELKVIEDGEIIGYEYVSTAEQERRRKLQEQAYALAFVGQKTVEAVSRGDVIQWGQFLVERYPGAAQDAKEKP